MSINFFIFFVLVLLLGMFSYFKLPNSHQPKAAEVPQFELDQFVIYEISSNRIDHFFEAEHGKRFSDRYEATGAKFTNNERALLESIRANRALYKDDVVYLNGDVHYVRADGLQFRSNEGVYDQKHSFVKTDGSFTLTKEQNSINGVGLHYDLTLDTVSADQIRGSYQLN